MIIIGIWISTCEAVLTYASDKLLIIGECILIFYASDTSNSITSLEYLVIAKEMCAQVLMIIHMLRV